MLLELRGVRAGYEGIPVVFGIDLEIREGEVVALLGSNGAGKTTTLRAISGMVPLMAGEIVFDGERIDGLAPEKIARRGLLHVPEGRGIFPTLTVGDTLKLAAAMAGAEGAERIEDAVNTFPRLAERATQTVGTLSGGEQQMLALARGLIVRPKLLMVDEMSQGLAPALVADLFDRIEAFAERGVSVLLVEQFVGQALNVAQRAYVLEKGEITYGGSSAKLAKDEAFVRGSYLGEIAGDPKRRARDGHFAEPVNVSLPPALLRTLEERAEREGVAVGDLIASVIEKEDPTKNGRKTPARGTRKKPAARRRER
jgi:branched-chain amino acid transport system ATP-binding protein